MVRRRWACLSALLVAYAASLACGDECDGLDSAKVAQQAFSRHRKNLSTKWHRGITFTQPTVLTNETMTSTAQLGREDLDIKLQCYAQFVYKHSSGYSAGGGSFSLGQLLYQTDECSKPALQVREQALLAALNGLLDSDDVQPGFRFTHDFRFWLDTTDACVVNRALSKALRAPLLSFGTGVGTEALPLPEPTALIAMLHARKPWFARFTQTPVGKMHEAYAGEQAELFKRDPYSPPWDDRQPYAVYRATCHKTINPFAYSQTQPAYLYLRGKLCRAAQDAPHGHDIGVFGYAGDCLRFPEWERPKCELCGVCADKSAMEIEDMVGYKFQVHVDGFGPALDELWWKMRSGSTVFYAARKGSPFVPYFVTWLTPLLKPMENFVPITFGNAFEQVEWCRVNDAACRAMGEESRRLFRCGVSMDTVVHYLVQALQFVHDVMGPQQ